MPNLSTKIKWNWETMRWEGIDIETDIKLWETLYPRVNVVQEITINMVAWLDKVKGTKKGNKRNWRRFICTWLKNAQQRR